MVNLLQHRAVELATEADAYAFLERLRWGDDGPTECPHCASEKGAWFLKPKDPDGRKSKGGSTARSQRRVWKCRENSCRRQFSVLTNTVMHATKMPVRAWVGTVFELCENPKGVSARDIASQWGVTPKSAFAMLTRIQDALANPEAGGARLGSNAPLWFELNPAERAAISQAEQAQSEAENRAAESARDAAQVAAERIEQDIKRALLEAANSRAVTPQTPAAAPVATRAAVPPATTVVPDSAMSEAGKQPAANRISASDQAVRQGAGERISASDAASRDRISAPRAASDEGAGERISASGAASGAASGDRISAAGSAAGEPVGEQLSAAAVAAAQVKLDVERALAEALSDEYSRPKPAAPASPRAPESTTAESTVPASQGAEPAQQPQRDATQKESTTRSPEPEKRRAAPAEIDLRTSGAAGVAPRNHRETTGRDGRNVSADRDRNAKKIRNKKARRSARSAADSDPKRPAVRVAKAGDTGHRRGPDDPKPEQVQRPNRPEVKGAGGVEHTVEPGSRTSNSRRKKPRRDARNQKSQPVDNSQRRSSERRRSSGESNPAGRSASDEQRGPKQTTRDPNSAPDSPRGGLAEPVSGTTENHPQHPERGALDTTNLAGGLGPEWALSPDDDDRTNQPQAHRSDGTAGAPGSGE